MRQFLLLFLFLAATISFSQVNFEKGYIVDNDNRKIECWIKNYDWEKNPVEFEYKLNESDSVLIGNLKTAKEFGINGISKYVRADVKIDRSPSGLVNLSKTRTPEWRQEVLFLKELVSGTAILYYYYGEKNLTRFFYLVPPYPVQQLIYKEYLLAPGLNGINNSFRQQLSTDVNCAVIPENIFKTITYRRSELVKYFKKYNQCVGDPDLVKENKQMREFFNLRITPGLNYSTMSITNSSGVYSVSSTFKTQVNFRLGLEGELVLPFNKNKWSIFIEPSFQMYDATVPVKRDSATIRYRAIESSFGLRHCFFLSDNAKLYLNIMMNTGTHSYFNSRIDYTFSTLEAKTSFNYGIGCGVAFKRFNAGVRYYNSKNILSGYAFWSTDYRILTFIAGYKFLQTRRRS